MSVWCLWKAKSAAGRAEGCTAAMQRNCAAWIIAMAVRRTCLRMLSAVWQHVTCQIDDHFAQLAFIQFKPCDAHTYTSDYGIYHNGNIFEGTRDGLEVNWHSDSQLSRNKIKVRKYNWVPACVYYLWNCKYTKNNTSYMWLCYSFWIRTKVIVSKRCLLLIMRIIGHWNISCIWLLMFNIIIHFSILMWKPAVIAKQSSSVNK